MSQNSDAADRSEVQLRAVLADAGISSGQIEETLRSGFLPIDEECVMTVVPADEGPGWDLEMYERGEHEWMQIPFWVVNGVTGAQVKSVVTAALKGGDPHEAARAATGRPRHRQRGNQVPGQGGTLRPMR